ncbi:TRAP transporter permease [Egibacter rhizosphaerae]|uniref:TRAP transporter permease n=1 Tax=Egibacter rhizosphaerae TaxID=1670831 RepID=A0A411YAW7_9ACTN|nr:TRAP transporter fused permease subunit [Egibacter rhizosphaerae]QBI18322.1 TRAP transporter permease [Egibacter rhizosphaerae]
MAQQTERSTEEGTVPEGEARSGNRQPAWLRTAATIAFYGVALFFTAALLYYYATGAGGPTQLAVGLVPVAYVLAALDDLRRGELYPRLPPLVSAAIAMVFIAVAAAAGSYLFVEFDDIRTVRVGRWNETDMLAGAALIVLLLEYSRRKYVPLFVLNLLLIAYVVYGGFIPGLFGHSGMSWDRVVTSMSLETSTGVFEQLPQLGLTLIGSFILVLAILRGFGAIDSILKGAQRLASRSPSLLPQAAVIGSFGVAAVSGSGAANAATTGSVTIPALIRSGIPRVRAAAIETATSLGGQLMPPLMGIAAFLMADFMGVSYFDIVARGFAPAIIYFLGVSLAVYLLAARFNAAGYVPDVERLGLTDKANLLAYAAAIAGLIWFMGVQRAPAMQSAQRVFFALLVVLSVMLVIRLLRSRELRQPRHLLAPYQGFVETFARMTSELTLLLATLGLVTASFTITGVPTAVGQVLVEVASINLVLVVLVAFVFGYVVGMGLPPAPTYIIVAVVIAPFMISAGLDPWQVHFYAFLIAAFGELSPPTSVTAAVTSKIADASFTRTMIRAIEMCLPLLILMVALFTWPEVVQEPGVPQLLPGAMVLVATLGIITSLHAVFSGSTTRNRTIRLVLGILSVSLLAHPILPIALPLALLVAAAIFLALRTTRARAAAELAQAREQAASGT